MNIVMIDNYDSFTFNLVHLVKEMGASVRVLRNDCFALDELEPYGVGNPRPTLCIRDAAVHTMTGLAGGKHTKLTIRKWDELYECVFFSRSIGDLGLREGCTVDVAFVPQINDFRGKRSVQLLLEDLKVTD